jgi:hypothetical protein
MKFTTQFSLISFKLHIDGVASENAAVAGLKWRNNVYGWYYNWSITNYIPGNHYLRK